MCTQSVHLYQCGCRKEGEFKQCDRLYDAQSNLRCANTIKEELLSRNYCKKHMPTEDKATTEYNGRNPRPRR